MGSQAWRKKKKWKKADGKKEKKNKTVRNTQRETNKVEKMYSTL